MSDSEHISSEDAAAPASAARTVELAAVTADQLVADAKAEAEALRSGLSPAPTDLPLAAWMTTYAVSSTSCSGGWPSSKQC
jgi:hypothetical protein